MPTFETFSIQHFSALTVFGLFTLLAIWLGMNSPTKTKLWIGFGISFLAFAVMFIDLIWRLATNTFRIHNDLPLYLCDLAVCLLPIFIYTQNRKWLGILYFWTLAGTLQALITPELEGGYPSFEFFRYFIMHAGIVSAVIYMIVIWKFVITWRDFFNAVIFIQIYIVGIHLLNVSLGTNYSYTVAKPHAASILDLLGEWPWYLFWGEIIMIILFLILMLPFLFLKRKIKEEYLTDPESQKSY